jgi:neurotransmitter:Na+ symporter, NSS family
MPALLLLLLILVGYGFTTGQFGAALAFLFTPDFSQIDGGVFLSAMGQAFFSLSLGMCTMMAYGAYLPKGISVGRVGVTVALADTGVALLAGMAIFPVVLAFGINPAGGGPGLIFTSLPLAFNAMPLGIVYGLLFFVLLAFAAWTSSISLMEPATAYLVEKTRLGRRGAALLIGGVCWTLGLASLLGFNHWSHVRLFGLDIMDFVAKVANDIMLPVGGLLIALFAGWVLRSTVLREELSDLGDGLFTAWRWLLRVVAPALVVIVLVRAFL